MRTIRRAIITVGALGLSLTAAACDDGDPEADGSTTATPPAPPSPPTTATSTPPTTAPSVVANTDPPTTTAPVTSTQAPPTTIDEEALKAEIAEDLVIADARLGSLLMAPSLENLEERVASVAAPGPYRDAVSQRLQDLVANNQRVIPGQPAIHSLSVEEIILLDASRASVTTCRVDNSAVVETSPDGESVVTPSNLTAVRDEHDVNLTSEGWLISSFDSEVLEIVRGVEACPG